MTDPIRDMFAQARALRRARSDQTYLFAELTGGNAPSPEAYNASIDMGHVGAEALEVARQLDQAAANFFTQPEAPNDQPPPAA